MITIKRYYFIFIPLLTVILYKIAQMLLKIIYNLIKNKNETIEKDLNKFKENINSIFDFNTNILIINYFIINIFGLSIEYCKILLYPQTLSEFLYKLISISSIFFATLFLIFYNIKMIDNLTNHEYRKYIFKKDKKSLILFLFSIIIIIFYVFIVKHFLNNFQIKNLSNKLLEIKNNKFPFYIIFTLTLIFILSFYEELIIRFNFSYLDKLLINKKRLSSILNPEKLNGILELSLIYLFLCFNNYLVKGHFFLFYNFIFSIYLFYIRKHVNNFIYIGTISGIYNILFLIL